MAKKKKLQPHPHIEEQKEGKAQQIEQQSAPTALAPVSRASSSSSSSLAIKSRAPEKEFLDLVSQIIKVNSASLENVEARLRNFLEQYHVDTMHNLKIPATTIKDSFKIKHNSKCIKIINATLLNVILVFVSGEPQKQKLFDLIKLYNPSLDIKFSCQSCFSAPQTSLRLAFFNTSGFGFKNMEYFFSRGIDPNTRIGITYIGDNIPCFIEGPVLFFLVCINKMSIPLQASIIDAIKGNIVQMIVHLCKDYGARALDKGNCNEICQSVLLMAFNNNCSLEIIKTLIEYAPDIGIERIYALRFLVPMPALLFSLKDIAPTASEYRQTTANSIYPFSILMLAVSLIRNDVLEWILLKCYSQSREKATALLNYQCEMEFGKSFDALCCAYHFTNSAAVTLLLKYNIEISSDTFAFALQDETSKLTTVIAGCKNISANKILISLLQHQEFHIRLEHEIIACLDALLAKGLNIFSKEEINTAKGKHEISVTIALADIINLINQANKQLIETYINIFQYLLNKSMETRKDFGFLDFIQIKLFLSTDNLYVTDKSDKVIETSLNFFKTCEYSPLVAYSLGQFFKAKHVEVLKRLLGKNIIDLTLIPWYLFGAISTKQAYMIKVILEYLADLTVKTQSAPDFGNFGCIEELFLDDNQRAKLHEMLLLIPEKSKSLIARETEGGYNIFLIAVLMGDNTIFSLLLENAEAFFSTNVFTLMAFIILYNRPKMLESFINFLVNKFPQDSDNLHVFKHFLGFTKDINKQGERQKIIEILEAEVHKILGSSSALDPEEPKTTCSISSSSSPRAFLLERGFSAEDIKNLHTRLSFFPDKPAALTAPYSAPAITWGGGSFSLSLHQHIIKRIENVSFPLFVLQVFGHLENLNEAIKQQFAAVRPSFFKKGSGAYKGIRMIEGGIKATIKINGEIRESSMYELKISEEMRLYGVLFPADQKCGPPLLAWFHYGPALHCSGAEAALRNWAQSTQAHPLTLQMITSSVPVEEEKKEIPSITSK